MLASLACIHLKHECGWADIVIREKWGHNEEGLEGEPYKLNDDWAETSVIDHCQEENCRTVLLTRWEREHKRIIWECGTIVVVEARGQDFDIRGLLYAAEAERGLVWFDYRGEKEREFGWLHKFDKRGLFRRHASELRPNSRLTQRICSFERARFSHLRPELWGSLRDQFQTVRTSQQWRHHVSVLARLNPAELGMVQLPKDAQTYEPQSGRLRFQHS